MNLEGGKEMDNDNMYPNQNDGTDPGYQPYGGNDSVYYQGDGTNSVYHQNDGSNSGYQQNDGSDSVYQQNVGTDSGYQQYGGDDSGYQQNGGTDSGYQQYGGNYSGYQQYNGNNSGSNYSQYQYNNNNNGYQNPYYVQPPQTDLEEPISVGEWILMHLIMIVPCVGLIMTFVWAFSSNEKKSKSNYFKAKLIMFGIVFALYMVLFMFLLFAGNFRY